jgi:valyl-tRNA synthetase
MFDNLDLSNSIDLSIKIISEIRSLRVEKNIPVKSFPKLFLKNVNFEKKSFISNNVELITNLAKLEKIIFSDDEKLIENHIISTVDEITLMIPLEGLINVEDEKKRLNKELTHIDSEITIIEKRLKNQSFIEKAPQKVVEEIRKKFDIYIMKKDEITKALKSI